MIRRIFFDSAVATEREEEGFFSKQLGKSVKYDGAQATSEVYPDGADQIDPGVGLERKTTITWWA